jgi:hypothetical protein
MMNLIALLSSALLLATGGTKGDGVSFDITNSCAFDREEVVEIVVPAKASALLKGDFVVVNSKGGQLTYQKEKNGRLLVYVKVPKSGKTRVTLRKGKPEKFASLVYGRQAPERMNDYLWENDKVAFRVYQKDLIAKDGPSNGFDYWAKSTSKLIINSWLKNELENKLSYHEDRGEGCDCYKVGRTLGCGAMAPYVGDSVVLGIDYEKCEVLENGPLRVTARLTYDPLDVAGHQAVEHRLITLDAGSYLSRITSDFQGAPSMEVAAGIALKDVNASSCLANGMNPNYRPVLEAAKGYIAYAETADKLKKSEVSNGVIYTAVVFSKALKKAAVEGRHILAVTEMPKGKSVVYYQGAATSKAGMTQERWNRYVEQFAQRLRHPLIIHIVNKTKTK